MPVFFGFGVRRVTGGENPSGGRFVSSQAGAHIGEIRAADFNGARGA